jgi:tetratricopeptide (TPR) repeat protein
MTDWYRNTTWNEAIESDFNARLKRSRTPFNRCQYLVIQAGTIRQSENPVFLLAAVALANRAVNEHPHPAFLAGAHLAKAHALVDLGRPTDAIDSFRAAVAAQRAYPGMKHLTHLAFGELALSLRRTDLYAEVEALFPEFGDADELFPANAFQSNYLRAAFAEAKGEMDQARRYAEKALAASRATQTEFRYHRKVGLFQGAAPDVLEHLRRLTTA